MSANLYMKGFNVTYVDIDGINMEFAKFLFGKKKLKIKVIDVERDWEEIWAKDYDTILCIDVIEHVTNPKELLENMINSLRGGGRLIINQIDCAGPTPEHPMHFKINFNVEEFLLKRGLRRDKKYKWLWVKEGDEDGNDKESENMDRIKMQR